MATDASDAVDNLEKELVTLARRLRGLQRTLSDEAHPDLEPAQYALLNHVEELAPVRMAAPSLGLLVVLYVGVSGKWAISSASIVALCTGYLLDLVSGAPQGVHALVFILICIFARALSTRVAVQGIVLSAATTAARSTTCSSARTSARRGFSGDFAHHR